MSGAREVRAIVPCRVIRPSVMRCVEEAMTNRTVSSILISVNGPPPSAEVRNSLLVKDERVRIQSHGHDIGLYRNFRSGLDGAFKFTKFFAEDDSSPPGLVDRLVSESSQDDLLILPDFSRRQWADGDFVGEDIQHPNNFEVGPRPRLDPSYLFGVWRTEFLLKHWPADPFDWLDYCLVVRAGRAGGVRRVPSGPLVLGFTPGRIPHSVNGVNHSSVRAALEPSRIALTVGRYAPAARIGLLRGAIEFIGRGCALNKRFSLPQPAYCRIRRVLRSGTRRMRHLLGRLPLV